MQYLDKEKLFTSKIDSIFKKKYLLLLMLVLFISVVLLGIFALANWAETATWHHAAQHIMIFIGGVGFGSFLAACLTNTKGENK